MSYEHGSAGSRFDLPNPMKAENLLMGIAGGICALLGFVLLMVSRGRMEGSGSAWTPILTALVLLVMGGTALARTFSQLRFFFGRGLPRNLMRPKSHYETPKAIRREGPVGEIQRGKTGNTDAADALKEVLRQQAIVFEEPEGPLNGLLYSAVPNLIYAPPPIQFLARQQFANAIKMLLTLLLVIVAMASGAASRDRTACELAQGWIGLGVLGYLLAVLFFTPSGAGLDDRSSQSRLSVKWVALRLVLAVVVPVLLVQMAGSLPALPSLSPFPHVFVLLLLAFGAYALIFFVLLREGNEAPATAVSQVQEAWSMNCHPGLVVGEFDRIMQSTWREQIPNRTYTRLEPVINPAARTGQFLAEMLEEYQPLPLDPHTPSLSEILQNPKLRLLTALTAFAGVSLITSGLSLFMWALQAMSPTPGASTWLTYGLITGALATASHRVSHALWQRFDFDSVLLFCEMKGQYVTAEFQHGNVMRDTVKATSSVTQIESMTFRLWVASLHSVCFGKRKFRYIRAMQPEDEAARGLADKLRAFAREQAIILAPSSQIDRERQAQLQNMNTPEVMAPPPVPTLAETVVAEASTTTRFCSSCGQKSAPGQRFCGGCGSPLASPA